MRTIPDIAHALATQDNRITHLPIFVVEQKRRIYGMDPDYSEDAIVWLYSDECIEVDGEEAASLEAAYEETRDVPEDYIRTAYKDIWEFVTACLTEDGAKAYIAVNGHNLYEPRIYVHSGYRNAEWEAVRKHLLAMAGPQVVRANTLPVVVPDEQFAALNALRSAMAKTDAINARALALVRRIVDCSAQDASAMRPEDVPAVIVEAQAILALAEARP